MSNIPPILDFLKRLSTNNNRIWFNEHKEEFETLRKKWIADIGNLLEAMSAYDSTLSSVDPKQCVYRIYRDIRFSPNKMPYKNHFGALLGVGGTRCQLACCYLHIQPESCGIYGGLWCPERNLLTKLRHSIDDNYEEFSEVIENPDFAKRFKIVGETLKKLPQGFDPATPAAKFVKMKEFLLEEHIDDSFFTKNNWIEATAREFSYMKPFNDFLNYTITEE